MDKKIFKEEWKVEHKTVAEEILEQLKEIGEKQRKILDRDSDSLFQTVEKMMLSNVAKGIWGGELRLKSDTGEVNSQDYLIIFADGKEYQISVVKLCEMCKQNGVEVSAIQCMPEELIDVNKTVSYLCDTHHKESARGKRCQKRNFILCGNAVRFIINFFTPANNDETLKIKLLREYARNINVFNEQVKHLCSDMFSDSGILSSFNYSAEHYYEKYPAIFSNPYGCRMIRMRIPNQPDYIDILQSVAKEQGITINWIDNYGWYGIEIKFQITIQQEKNNEEFPYIDVLRQKIEKAKIEHERHLKDVDAQRAEIPNMFADMLPKVKMRLIDILTKGTDNSSRYAYITFIEDNASVGVIRYSSRIFCELASEYESLFAAEGLCASILSSNEYIESISICLEEQL